MKKFFKSLIAIVVVLLLLATAMVVKDWAPDRSVEQLQARWAGAPSVFVGVDGMQVHVRDEGPRDDPEPIVLLHGTSASLHTWEAWAQALKSKHRVIRFDLPGFGLTGPSPSNDYSMVGYSKFVVDMLDRLGVAHCVLGGNSLGGEIAWETAARYPQRVSRLILVDAAGYLMQAASLPIGFRIAKIPMLKPLMESTLPRWMIASSVRSVYSDPSKVTPDLIDRYYELTLRAGNRGALGQRFAQSSFGKDAARIATIKQPTLILWGADDHLIDPAKAQQFHQDIAGSQLVILDHLGHVPQEEGPQESLAPVEKFLASTH